MSALRPKSCLPIKVIPWIATAAARSKETLKDGAARPIHSYAQLGRLSLPADNESRHKQTPQRQNQTLQLRSKSSEMKVATKYVEEKWGNTAPYTFPEERQTPINLSDYIESKEFSVGRSRLSGLQVLRKRHKNYLKKLKRGPSLTVIKQGESQFHSEPAAALYVFNGTTLPHRSPSACSLSVSMLRKRLSLGYTKNLEGHAEDQRSLSPLPKPIVAQGKKVRLKPKQKH